MVIFESLLNLFNPLTLIAMTMGVVVGTYSSIYIAGSTTIWLDNLANKMKRA